MPLLPYLRTLFFSQPIYETGSSAPLRMTDLERVAKKSSLAGGVERRENPTTNKT